MPLKLVTPPIGEPLTVAEVKDQLKITWADEDTWFTGAIKTAREFCEGSQKRRYITQTWEKYLDNWPCSRHYSWRTWQRYRDNRPQPGDYIELVPGLQAVESVKYTDRYGIETVFGPENYEVDNISLKGRIVLAPGRSWPTAELRSVNGVCIKFTCGYGNADAVPDTIKQAMKMVIGYWYENREAFADRKVSKEVDFALESLLSLEEAPVI